MEKKEEVKTWYDGFNFGRKTNIYNPWSITSYLSKRKAGSYWANTDSNGLADKLIREGKRIWKRRQRRLLRRSRIKTTRQP